MRRSPGAWVRGGTERTCTGRIHAGAVSTEEARRKCPGLQVLPMRTDRYRAVSEAVLSALRDFAADRVVQRQGYDDFYLDITESCSTAAAAGAADLQSEAEPPPGCRVVLAGVLHSCAITETLRGDR